MNSLLLDERFYLLIGKGLSFTSVVKDPVAIGTEDQFVRRAELGIILRGKAHETTLADAILHLDYRHPTSCCPQPIVGGKKI